MDLQLQDYEKKHIDFLRQNAHESTLLLKRDNAFPVYTPCTVALYGNGARKTIKGGTGSGDVASRFFVNFEQGLTEAGFTVTTKDWLDSYDEISKNAYKDYVKETKKAAKSAGYMSVVFSMGYFPAEPEYDLPLNDGADMAVYVLARNSGEGNDRRLIPGDVYLSKTEIRDILWLNEHYDRFMLVLNVGGVVDLSPVTAVRNILCISQLGVVTGSMLPDIILGKANPSGKLTTTWARPEDYPTYDNFGTLQDVDYKEGIYVGYRYFDRADGKPLFPFGFGLSYSEFEISYRESHAEGTRITVKAEVKNISSYPGKEVVQLYVSEPDGALDKAEKQLAAFKKTKLLAAGQTEEIELCFDLKDIASY
ncbi:MAG: glycoside hydrolase family 3 C-terminal domain-containing protein, partial [Lachnospiraceae bacterium]|nr:glycoside hydrolase family 3 C-terminal domain-containing protein [Lachnospiraceae bacterium]